MKYRIHRLSLPESYEHYHWGLWLLFVSILSSQLVPETFQTATLVPPGIALSLILDENRTGIGGHPFGLGKDYVRLSIVLGLALAGLVGAIYPSTAPPIILSALGVLFPFLAMQIFHWVESR